MMKIDNYPVYYQHTLPIIDNTKVIDPEDRIEQLAHFYKQQYQRIDIDKAWWLIGLGYYISKIETKNRNFKQFADIPDFTHANLDAAIALSKIKGVENICNFGWNKLYYFYINSRGIRYREVSLESISRDFGDISEDSVEKGIIKIVLKSNKINPQKINELWNIGLRLEMLHDKRNIKKINESGNIWQTINGIIHKYERKTKPKVKNDFEIYLRNILLGIKTKEMMNITEKYDYIIDEEIVKKDLLSILELFIRVKPIFEKDKKERIKFLSEYIEQM